MNDEEAKALTELMAELERGRQSADEDGELTMAEIDAYFEEKLADALRAGEAR